MKTTRDIGGYLRDALEAKKQIAVKVPEARLNPSKDDISSVFTQISGTSARRNHI